MNRQREVDGLTVSGLTELALGAQTGWLMAVAVIDPDRLKALGVQSAEVVRKLVEL